MALLDKEELNEKEKNRKRIFKKILKAHLFITPYIAYFPHQIMETLGRIGNGTQDNFNLVFDWNYFKAWYVLLIERDPGMILFWLITEVLFGLLLFSIYIKPRPVIANIKEYPITDYLSIPIPAGSGQHGSSWFATVKDRERLTNVLEFKKKGSGTGSGWEPEIKKSGIILHMEKADSFLEKENTKKSGIPLKEGLTKIKELRGKTTKELIDDEVRQPLKNMLEKEMERQKKKVETIKNKITGNTPEKEEEDEKKSDEIDRIYYMSGFAHSLILALTGAGKTRRILLQSIVLQIMAGECILVSDVKGEIYYYTSQFAKKHGYKVITIDLNNALKSSHYNFLQPIIDALQEGRKKRDEKIKNVQEKLKELATSTDPDNLRKVNDYTKEIELLEKDYSWTDKAQDYNWDLVAIFAGEQKGEPLWYNGETATMAACIMAVCLDAKEEYWNLYNVYNFIAYMGQEDPNTHKTPLSAYLNQLPDSHPAKMIFMQSQVAAERTRASFYTSALGTLRLFTKPSLAEMSSSSDFDLSVVGTDKVIIYLIIPDEKKTLYPVASVLINQLYTAQVETARKSGGMLPIQTNYDLDEIGNFPAIPVMSNLLSVGRSRGIRANLIIQDYQQLEKIYKDDFETIKTQCGLKIFLKSDNNKTLEDISKTLGEYTVETPNASTSANTDLKTDNSNISNGSSLSGRRLLQESELAKIKAPDALVMITGERPMMTKLPDLSEYQFNEVLGLGNEEHNRKLIERLEKERPEREFKQIPLWGVWNEYKAVLEEEAKRQMQQSGISNQEED